MTDVGASGAGDDAPAVGELDQPELAPLGPRGRALAMILAWGTFVASSPGVLAPAGQAALAPLALALWAWAAVRPGRRAFAVEWAVAAVALGGLMWWLAYVSPFTVPPAGIGKGLYMAVAGALARSLAQRLPLALAAALAWTALETLRDLIPPPFGMGWVRLAHCASDFGPLVESARVWGPAGVSFALAAVGCGVGTAVLERSSTTRALRNLALGAGALTVALVLPMVVRAPVTELGPTVVAVQPNIAQSVKQQTNDLLAVMRDQARLTRESQIDAPADLVVWSETMVRTEIAAPEARELAAAGVGFEPWHAAIRGEPEEFFERLDTIERWWIWRDLFGEGVGGFAGGGALREGTAFLGGVEEWRAVEGGLRRFNVGCLWTPDGERATSSKSYLVPLGETTYGYERFEVVRTAIRAMAGYIPDFDFAPPTPLTFADREGRAWRVGVPICFDNAFVESFTGVVDFNVVLSNEAWYQRAFEMDQMIAFTRLAAAATGRSVVRCTNSGVSALIGPDGRELDRLVVDGDDREVAGALRVQVPVPADPGATTPFVALRPLVRSAWVLLGLVPLFLPRRRR